MNKEYKSTYKDKAIENPHVSVIVPVYNEERHIAECVNSIRKQNSRPVEIIVVDDGSKDNSKKICKDLKLEVLSQNHKGPGAARNLAAGKAIGNILVFVDADMAFAPNYIHKITKPIIAGKAIATCHWNERVANWENPWARCQTWFMGLPDGMRQPKKAPLDEEVYRAVRKDFFLDSGGFSESEGRADDSSIFRRTGIKAKIVSDAICFHSNCGSLNEALIDSKWHGRNLAVEKNDRFRRVIAALAIQRNPLIEVLKGIILSAVMKEPRLIPYSIIFTYGFYSGAFHALFSNSYLK